VVSGSTVSMPQLIGVTQAQAEQTIYLLRLTVGAIYEEQVTDPGMVGRIVDQTPAAYKEVMRNSQVSFTVGIPSEMFYQGDVTLNLREMLPNTTVSIRVRKADGTESVPYSRTFAERPEEDELTVTLYNDQGGDMTYSVYFDDILRYSDIVSYTR